MTLTEFLLARIAEDEQDARDAICKCGGPACTVELGWYRYGEAMARLENDPAACHVVRWSLARVLAECEAKRRIVDLAPWANNTTYAAMTDLLGHLILRTIALPYADHPDYQQEWAL